MKTESRIAIELRQGLGLRREAQLHAAFARTITSQNSESTRTPESGVAAALCHRSPRRWHAVAATLVFVAITTLADVPSGKWVSLFNGTNLNGWVVMNGGKFSVTNSAIQIGGGMGWLRTERAFTNFVLEVEWRGLETNYNSGIFLRAGLVGKPMPTNGWQANLKQADLGAWLKNKGIQFSPQPPIVPVGEWAKFTLEAHGTNATLWLNSEKLWTSGFDATSGFIGIQAEEKRMELRSLRVLELP